MRRTPLEHGSILQLNNRSYTVDSVIGDGATCIVYSAYYDDNIGLPHRVNIKECYPYNANMIRSEKSLFWESEEEKNQSLDSFYSAYEKLMNYQNGNFTAHAFDICEANGTLYIVMDANEGAAFDKDDSASLTDILKTVRLLAYVVGNYHRNGYLHLDIKPSNFLVYPRPSEHIVLFDMDTVMALDDIKSGKVKCVPYSKGWAAPEQMQGHINKLCPATDIYSIGAILFEKIMGRNVEPADTGLFADWDFDGELFKNVNPKIKRLLRAIFRKTLSANIKRRYQNADELITALEEAVKTAEQKTYLLSDYIVSDINFVGRKNDLLKIDELFDNGTKAVFLHGFGGVGKTALATKYAEIYGKEYDCVKFCRYANGLKQIIDSLEIANESTDSSDEHRKLLKTVLNDTRTLIIIDNFDVEDDEELEYLLSLNFNVLFTTRNDYSQYISSEKLEIIELESLPTDALIQVFKNEYGRDITDREEELVQDIIEKFGNLTIIVPMIAKQILSSHISIEEFASSIEGDVFARFNEDNEDIRIRKDGKSRKTNSLDYLRAMFNIAALSEDHKTALRYLYLLRSRSNLTVSEYRKYTGEKNLNVLNDLAFRNWVTIDKSNSINHGEIRLHQLIYDLTVLDLKPNSKNCCMMLDNITKKFKIENKYAHEVRAKFRHKKLIEQALNRQSAENVICVLNSLDYEFKDDVNYIVDFIYNRFNGDLYDAQYCICDQLFTMLFSLLNCWKKRTDKYDYKLNSVIVFLYILYCMGTEYEIHNEEDKLPQEIKDVIQVFKTTITEFENCTDEYSISQLYLFLKPYMYAMTDFDIRIKLDAEFEYGVSDNAYSCIDKFADLPICDNELIGNFSEYYLHYKKTMQSSPAAEDIKRCQLSTNELEKQPEIILSESLRNDNADITTAVNSILLDKTIVAKEKNNIIELAFFDAFTPLRGKSQIKIEKRHETNWSSFIEPLKMHAEFFECSPKSTKRDGGKFDLCFNLSRCRLAYVYALLDNPKASDILEQVYKQIEERHLSTSTIAWWNDKTAMPRFYVDFDIAIQVFSNIEKTHIILPYLLRYTDLVINNSSSVLNFEESMMFEWYDKICVYSKEAYKQTKDKYYWQVFKNYEMKLKNIGRDSV